MELVYFSHWIDMPRRFKSNLTPGSKDEAVAELFCFFLARNTVMKFLRGHISHAGVAAEVERFWNLKTAQARSCMQSQSACGKQSGNISETV